MTNREYYNAILAIEGLSAELTEATEARIAKLDEINEKRKNAKPSAKELAKQEESAAFRAQVLELLSEMPILTSAVAEALEVSPQKASSALRRLVADGQAEETVVKVPKKGNQKAYSIVIATDVE